MKICSAHIYQEEKFYKLFLQKSDSSWIQFFRYIFVGGFSAIVNIGGLYIFTEIFNIHYLISNIIAFTLGLTINYILSKCLVFTSSVKINKFFELLVYCLIGSVGLGLDTLFMWIGTSKLGIYYILTKIISTALVFVWNFLGRKGIYVIFAKRSVTNE